MRNSRFLLVALASLSMVGCGRAAGLNFDCRSVPDTAFPLDLRSEEHVQHLVHDIRQAEELAIRYGDRVAGWRLVETFGIVTQHGGAKNRDLGRKARETCLATLLGAVGSVHGVTASEIQSVRPRLADRGFDPPITVPVAMLLIFAAMRFMRWLPNRFDTDERLDWLGATFIGSVTVPIAVLAIGGIWAGLVEIVRLGNGNVGSRMSTVSLRANFLMLLVGGIGAIWLGSALAAVRKRSGLQTPVA